MNAIVVALIIFGSYNVQDTISGGLNDIENERWQQASDKFNEAINSGHLSDYGLSEIYWNLYIAEKNLYHKDESATALLGFLTYARISLQDKSLGIKELRSIKDRIDFSEPMLQALWASNNSHSCRSKLFECYMAKEDLLSIFVVSIPFCSEQIIGSIDTVKNDNGVEVKVICFDINSFNLDSNGFGHQGQITKIENYYFVIP